MFKRINLKLIIFLLILIIGQITAPYGSGVKVESPKTRLNAENHVRHKQYEENKDKLK